MFNNKKILITGGTGSFGKAFVSMLVKKYKNIKKLIIFSRDEYKQYEMQLTFSREKYKYAGRPRQKNVFRRLENALFREKT